MAADMVWGIVVRAFYIVFMIFFLDLAPQLRGLGGDRGISPVGKLLEHVAREVQSNALRFRIMPTVFWFIGTSDATLVGTAFVGAAACFAAAIGGTWARVCGCIAWVSAVSLAAAFGDWIIYPWDYLVLEMGFLVLLLPTPHILWESVTMSAQVNGFVVFAFHLLYVRLLVGFGRTKFKKTWYKGAQLGYLKCFLCSQPLPSKIGLMMYHAPLIAHILGVFVMFAIEMILPFAAFFPGICRKVTAIATMGFMIMIQICGNFGVFNILTVVLTLTLLDGDCSLVAAIAELPACSGADWVRAIIVCLHTGLAAFYAPHNWWTSSVWMFTPCVHERWSTPLRRCILHVLRALAPLHLVHSYGVFPADLLPPQRMGLEIFGSDDGEAWTPYKFKRHAPSGKLANFAPHHPRLDQHLFYAAHTIQLPDAVAWLNPFLINSKHWLDRLAQRLLEPHGSPVCELFSQVPGFGQDGRSAPKYIQIRRRLYAPCSFSDMLNGLFLAESEYMPMQVLLDVSLDPTIWELPKKEALHWQLFSWADQLGSCDLQLAQQCLRSPNPGLAMLAACKARHGPEMLDKTWELLDMTCDLRLAPRSVVIGVAEIVHLLAAGLFLKVREAWSSGDLLLNFGELGNAIFYVIELGEESFLEAMVQGLPECDRSLADCPELLYKILLPQSMKQHARLGLGWSTQHLSFTTVGEDWQVRFWDDMDR